MGVCFCLAHPIHGAACHYRQCSAQAFPISNGFGCAFGDCAAALSRSHSSQHYSRRLPGHTRAMAGHDLVQPWVHPTVSGIRSICLDAASLATQRICNRLHGNFWRSGAANKEPFSKCATAILPCGGAGIGQSGERDIVHLFLPAWRGSAGLVVGIVGARPATDWVKKALPDCRAHSRVVGRDALRRVPITEASEYGDAVERVPTRVGCGFAARRRASLPSTRSCALIARLGCTCSAWGCGKVAQISNLLYRKAFGLRALGTFYRVRATILRFRWSYTILS